MKENSGIAQIVVKFPTRQKSSEYFTQAEFDVKLGFILNQLWMGDTNPASTTKRERILEDSYLGL